MGERGWQVWIADGGVYAYGLAAVQTNVLTQERHFRVDASAGRDAPRVLDEASRL